MALGWDTRGQPHFRQTLDQARATATSVEIVTGAVLGWEEPWARARRVEVLGMEAWTVRLREGTSELQLSCEEIRAIRLAGESPSREVRLSSTCS